MKPLRFIDKERRKVSRCIQSIGLIKDVPAAHLVAVRNVPVNTINRIVVVGKRASRDRQQTNRNSCTSNLHRRSRANHTFVVWTWSGRYELVELLQVGLRNSGNGG